MLFLMFFLRWLYGKKYFVRAELSVVKFGSVGVVLLRARCVAAT